MRATCDSPSFVGCEKWGAESTETEWASKQAFASRAGGGATPEASKQRSSESRVRPAGSVFPCNSEYKPALPCAFRAAAILARCALLLLLARALSPLSPSFRASHREAPGSPSQPTRRRPPPGNSLRQKQQLLLGQHRRKRACFFAFQPGSELGWQQLPGRTDGRTDGGTNPTGGAVWAGGVRPSGADLQAGERAGGGCVCEGVPLPKKRSHCSRRRDPAAAGRPPSSLPSPVASSSSSSPEGVRAPRGSIPASCRSGLQRTILSPWTVNLMDDDDYCAVRVCMALYWGQNVS